MDWADRVGRRVKLRDLHILLAVAECGSMAKASSQLSVSHPVVSKTIAELERTLGVQLLDRSSQGVEITTHGEALLNCGVTVFNEMRRGLKLLEALSDPASGEVRIGCPEITMAGLLPAIVERFFQQYPRIRLQVVLAQTAMLQFRELRERNIDLLIGRLPQELSADDLVSEILFDEPFSGCRPSEQQIGWPAACDFGGALWRTLGPAAVQQHPRRAYSSDFPRQQVAAAAAKHHYSVRTTDRDAHRERRICRSVAELGCASQQTGGIENTAAQVTGRTHRRQHCHGQEAHPQPSGQAVHRLCARSGKTDGRPDEEASAT
jgi:DNA-binding transcriptional LysR family regulator